MRPASRCRSLRVSSPHLQGITALESRCRGAGGDGAVRRSVLPRSVHESHRVQVDAVLQRRLAVWGTARPNQHRIVNLGTSLREGAMRTQAARVVSQPGLP